MPWPQYQSVVVTTDGDGDATVYTTPFHGRLVTIAYTKDATDPFAAGVDFDVTTAETGQTVWDEDDVNASKTVAPRQPIHGTDGVASVYASGGEPVEDLIRVAGEALKIVVANGGAAKVGSFTVIWE